jgi:dihydrofolate reductase
VTVPLIYFNTTSLDGFIADADGNFDFAEPDHEVHTFVNELVGPARLHLYGRRNYEIMTPWEGIALDDLPPAERDFAHLWNQIDKVVYSTTLTSVSTPRTELRPTFDADEVRRWKEERDTPILIGGGNLASAAARAGVLDEVHAIVAPAIVGSGTRFLGGGARLDLDLVDEKRFANGLVYLAYRVSAP